jgi:hypothetical protein
MCSPLSQEQPTAKLRHGPLDALGKLWADQAARIGGGMRARGGGGADLARFAMGGMLSGLAKKYIRQRLKEERRL